jgi:molybdopterin synthase catalytic subunit
MHVDVRYYAMLKERRGLDAERVEVPEGTTARALYELLFPAPRVPVQAAVAHAVVSMDTPLRDGDEVVFLPPVGGG